MLHAVPRQTHKTMRYPFRTQRINPQRVPSIPAPTGGGGRARPKQVLCASNTHSTYRGIPNHTMGATSVLDHRRGGGGEGEISPINIPSRARDWAPRPFLAGILSFDMWRSKMCAYVYARAAALTCAATSRLGGAWPSDKASAVRWFLAVACAKRSRVCVDGTWVPN
jgi:hypothetical protein